eukprot:TRINITY_DN66068_c0_g1_i2.p1 TRINITY_DN66068_c0_g1~~TRINITY_DN66068_c0_g1_i2.p1  ORF type:complete len:328 (+),score=23.38 TRINITY_DN66068_c0_g1_i2:29-985(+)
MSTTLCYVKLRTFNVYNLFPLLANVVSCISCIFVFRFIKRKLRRLPLDMHILHISAADLGFHTMSLLHYGMLSLDHPFNLRILPDCQVAVLMWIQLISFYLRNAFLFASILIECSLAILFILNSMRNTGKCAVAWTRCLPLSWAVAICLSLVVRSSFCGWLQSLRECEAILAFKLKLRKEDTIVLLSLIDAVVVICLVSYLISFIASILLGQQSKRSWRALVYYPLNYMLSYGPIAVFRKGSVLTLGTQHQDVTLGWQGAVLWTCLSCNGLLNCLTYMLQNYPYSLLDCDCGEDDSDGSVHDITSAEDQCSSREERDA